MFLSIINRFRYFYSRSRIIKILLFPAVVIRHSIIRRKRSRNNLLISNIEKLLVNEPELKVDEFKGVFKMDVHSDIFSRVITEKKYEAELADLCNRFMDRNRDVIDVGANIGFFSVLFAKTLVNGRVFSVEPSPQALHFLYHNLELNGVKDRVDVFEGVVSDKSGKLEIRSINGKPEYTTLGVLKHPSAEGREYNTRNVASITLDELVHSRSINPGFIKIDVEGMEHLVLGGATWVLNEKRPVILSELSAFLLRQNGSSSKVVISLLERAGYEVFDPLDLSVKPGWKDFGDIICFPRELNVKLIL